MSLLTNKRKRYTLLIVHKAQTKINHYKETVMKNINSKKTLTTLAWFAMLLVVGSIIFSSYIVYFGTTDIMAKALLIPQIAFAVGVLIYKFVK